MIRALLASALLIFSAAGQADTVTYLGRSLNVVPPQDFCVLGSSAPESSLVDLQRKSTSGAGELAQFSVPCEELAEFRSGKIDNFSRWAQVLVLKAKGQLKPVMISRPELVRKLAGSFADSPPDMNAVEKRIRDEIATTGVTITPHSTKPIGATQEAFFIELRGTIQKDQWSSNFIGIGAVTVVNQLPVAVYAYGTPKARGELPTVTASAYLRNVIDNN